jgi:transcription-repair coupling factor (superfamily II helicase)
LGIAKLEAGPKAFAMTLTAKTPAKVVAALKTQSGAVQREDRLVFEHASMRGVEQLVLFEQLLSAVRRPSRHPRD